MQTLVENPDATFADLAQAGKENIATALGLHAVGHVAGKAKALVTGKSQPDGGTEPRSHSTHNESQAIQSDLDTLRDDWSRPDHLEAESRSFNGDAISEDQRAKHSSFDSETGELQYKADYYKKVGRQKDNLDAMTANLEKQGIKVSENDEGASYTPIESDGKTIGHQITHGPTTKKWELLEEYAHHRVELGWKKKEIEELTKQLKKGRRKPFGGWHKIKAPGRVAEEIIVKQHLLDHASSLGEPERERLRETIKQLYNHGLEDGY